MRIGMVLEGDFPPDIRVEKEARALLAAGHEIYLLGYGSIDINYPTEEDVEGVVVRRIPPIHLQSSRPGQWNYIRFHLTFQNRYWAVQIKRYVRDFHIDVLHVHDLPLVGTAISVGRRLGIPVIADLHENMAAAFRIRRTNLPPVKRTMDAIFHNYYLWRLYEKQVLPRCARVIVVVREAAERLYGYGLNRDKVVLVSNTEDETTFRLDHLDPDILKRYKNQWVVGYIGGIGPHRGVDTAIRAAPLAAQQIPNFRLVVVGAKSERHLNPLMRLVRQLVVDEWVEILSWQPFSMVGSYIAASAVCLVPYNDSEHTQTTVPHKLFQYMIAGKPVVVSDVRPLKRIVKETQSGLVFKANDPVSLAQAIIKLYRTPYLRRRLGRNGHRAARGAYAWRHDARVLVELYRKLEKDEKM